MKTLIYSAKFKLSLILIFQSIIVIGQQNDFKIGVWGDDSYTTIGNDIEYNKYKLPNIYSSPLGVYWEDGINLLRTYQPYYNMSVENYKQFIKLVGNCGMTLIDNNEAWFRPPTTNGNPITIDPPIGTFEYSSILCPNLARYNLDLLNDQVYKEFPYKNTIFGHVLSGESNFQHFRPTSNHCPQLDPINPPDAYTIENYTRSEIPPESLWVAMNHFRILQGNEQKALIHVLAVHGGSISPNTPNDIEGSVKVQDYFSASTPTYKGDLFIEGSYFSKIWDQWRNETIPNNFDYLGKFKSIDFTKKYYNKVFAEICVSFDIWNDGNVHFWNSNPTINNGNNMWFQTYTSIIHGVKGIILWGLPFAWNPSDTEDANNQQLFGKGNFYSDNYKFELHPHAYRDLISNLTKELRYLKECNFLSDDDNSIIFTKTIDSDPNCILEASTNYLNDSVKAIDASDLNLFYNNSALHDYKNFHRTEDFGVRYSIRTNGVDYIMIATNPNPYCIHDVNFDFNNIANPDIRNSSNLTMLFQNSIPVHFPYYNEDREWISRADFKNNIINNLNLNFINENMQKYDISYNTPTDKSINLDFGPFDVRILKFNRAETTYPNFWHRTWSNNGSGNIKWGVFKDIDYRVIGDFNGDGISDYLCIQSPLQNQAWSILVGFDQSTNQFNNWLWCNNDEPDTIGALNDWSINAFDKYLAGNFTGSQRDELLCVQGINSNATAALYSYNENNHTWKDHLWMNSQHEGLGSIKWWAISSIDKYISGNFDGDSEDKDELLLIQNIGNSHAWGAMIGWDPISEMFNNWLWCNNDWEGIGFIKDWNIEPGDKFISGDFDNDGKDELLCIQSKNTNARCAIYKFLESKGIWGIKMYDNNSDGKIKYFDSNSNICFWVIKPTDEFIVGDYYATGNDELLCIQNGDIATISKLLSFNLGNWSELWSDNTIFDWSINGGSEAESYGYYYPFNLKTASGNKQTNVFALRKYKCEKYLASLYEIELNKSSIPKNISNEPQKTLEHKNNQSISIYPNPNNGIFTVRVDNGGNNQILLEINNFLGMKIFSRNLINNIIDIDLKDQPSGVYSIRITVNQNTINKKFIITK